MFYNHLKNPRIKINPLIQNLTNIDSLNQKLIFAVNNNKLISNCATNNKVEKLAANPSLHIMKEPTVDNLSFQDSYPLSPVLKANNDSLNTSSRKLKIKLEKVSKTNNMLDPAKIIRKKQRKSNNNLVPVIA